MYINNVPIFIPMPSSNGKGGKSGNNKFFVYGIFLLVVGVFVTIMLILLDLFFDVGLLFHPKVALVGLLWLLIMLCLFVASELYKNQTDKEIFESIGRDLIKLYNLICNLIIIGFVAVIVIMIYDIVAQKEVITQTKANIIMGSAITLNIIRYIVCAKNKKNTKKMRKKK